MSVHVPRKDPPAQRPQPTRNGPDFWATPQSLVDALVHHVLPALPRAAVYWEPASGDGRLVTAIRGNGVLVFGSDLYPLNDDEPVNFLTAEPPSRSFIVTNGPFNAVDDFIGRILALLDSDRILGATLLLRHDHLMAKGRAAALNRATWEVHCNWRARWIADSEGAPRWSFAWVTWMAGPRRPPLYLIEPDV